MVPSVTTVSGVGMDCALLQWSMLHSVHCLLGATTTRSCPTRIPWPQCKMHRGRVTGHCKGGLKPCDPLWVLTAGATDIQRAAWIGLLTTITGVTDGGSLNTLKAGATGDWWAKDARTMRLWTRGNHELENETITNLKLNRRGYYNMHHSLK